MKLYTLARKINKKIKQRRREVAGRYLFPVRRLERFAVPQNERIVSMTFDDGPTNMPVNPVADPGLEGVSLTRALIGIMNDYDARGTFNVIGTTEHNYPDKMGSIHKPTWSGVRHDHYPMFGKDKYAGAENQKELVRELLKNGHEISNHGYRHVLFGRNNIVYGSREHFTNIHDVVSDLRQLHELMKNEFDYEMTMSRPPHYIDRIPDGFTSYDAYAVLGYDYLAASFDGGGWMPTVGDYKEDVRKMVDPLKNTLRADANALCGQIIFQKDGFNMSLMSPVATALREQLEVLSGYGYKVVTVRELKDKYPFEDFNDFSKNFEIARELDRRGYIIGYRTNEFKPDKTLTVGEMVMMTMKKSDYGKMLMNIIGSASDRKKHLKHPYYLGFLYYDRKDLMERSDEEATKEDIVSFFGDSFGIVPSISGNTIKRFEYLEVLSELIKN